MQGLLYSLPTCTGSSARHRQEVKLCSPRRNECVWEPAGGPVHCPSLALLLPDRDSRRFCNWERPEWLSARGPRYGSDLKRIEEAPRALTPSSMQRQCPQSMNPSPFKHESFCAVLLNVRLGVVLNVVSLRSSSYCLALGVTISIMAHASPRPPRAG